MRATNGRPYGVACTSDYDVGASIARPHTTVSSVFSIPGYRNMRIRDCVKVPSKKG